MGNLRPLMAELCTVTSALPEYTVTQSETRRYLASLLNDSPAIRRLQAMADHSRIAQRHLVAPPSDLVQLQSIEARQRQYLHWAVELGEQAARNAMSCADVDPSSIGAVISVSCTGYAMPSVDVHLSRRLGINPAARRIPITELGCAAGVGAIGLAHDLLSANIRCANALVVATEICSLCMQTVEPAMSDVLGWILFGDAAAAAVLRRNDTGAHVTTLGSRSVVWPDSTADLGMRLTTTGLRLELSSHVPRLVRRHLRGTVEAFLNDYDLQLGDIAFWAIHPGGPRILDAVSEGLGVAESALRPTWQTWEECGNVSSATVFLVLERILRRPLSTRGFGMMLAVGPGVSCEMVLLRS